MVMASTTISPQAVAVTGLCSSGLRDSSITRLQGMPKVGKSSTRFFSSIRAAKLPQGVATPKEEPKLPVSFWGFTRNAEVWNSRASMIGIFGVIIVEAIINKGILQAIGIDVGNGLDLPL
ncbi:light-harvesting complex-like protein OHP1, chloroplastic [Physcomitrium patens]|nr:light-harvesting complex-like protein OHP1, chloroplastic [Physcomitrium patens]|eukprot:XP_024360819.1 light-harvesting complex-like protein OHP1, chloroplastic [Physcomitrella patens]